MGKKLTAKEIVKISREMAHQGFDICSKCGGVELSGCMSEKEDLSDDLICEECLSVQPKKEYEVQVTRYYSGVLTFYVEARSPEEARELAKELSCNADYNGRLLIDDVTAEIV